ncbi:MAG: hypothetical protein QY327_03500 [Fimbriimonadaceae bacterium]|nr:MAG: hypothetical protein UZ18_ATM001001748 [Armatimonadetes bacterium OLB18]WKZ80969.1 MAG: hypothetical protein QY327_03500 [Fimbriimonadaceae bacterium]
MFGVISYVGICMVASGVLSALYVITRPIHIRDEMRSWRLWAGLSVVLMILPYAAFEVQTHTVGKEMAYAAEEVIAHSDIQGDLKYYKVLFTTGSWADVVVVGEEPNTWGGIDRPVVRAKLVREEGEWVVASSHLVYSDNQNVDGIVFPPFW